MSQPGPQIAARVARLLRQHPVAWRSVAGGYSDAGRWIVSVADGRTFFVKAGTLANATSQLRNEHERVYSKIQAPFLPRVIGWEDDGATPLLILEDLSRAHWPPPWTGDRIEAVVETLAAVRRAEIHGLPELWRNSICQDWWRRVALNDAHFLALGLASPSWLRTALPILSSASTAALFQGDDLLHLDVRSDNLCFLDDRVILIDWNAACLGNGAIDLATWLPSLQSEGGPPPETILQNVPEIVAWMTGFWAWHAGLPDIPNAPRVREVQRRQLRYALPWAVRALGLPPLDGAQSLVRHDTPASTCVSR